MNFSGLRVAPPGEHFYVIIFGAQPTPKLARYTHSWATFIHATERGQGQEPLIEARTISWFPATLDIRPWSFHLEPGVNLGLHKTLQYTFQHKDRVAEWGPYECRPSLYYRAVVQQEFLESGRMAYQTVDTVGEAGRTGLGCDCIHAITDMDPRYSRARYRLVRYGFAASRYIAHELGKRGVLLDPDHTEDWLNHALGLDGYPIERHKYPGRLPADLIED